LPSHTIPITIQSDLHKNIKVALEEYYKDAVDLEFTIQDGKLWVLQARPAKRTGIANLKITTDLFFQKVIDLNEVISRIRFRDFEEILTPTIKNESSLLLLGQGLPASPGAATGRIYFIAEDVLDRKQQTCILCRFEYSPEDLYGMDTAVGLVSSRGGMTSHAAVVSRGMGKPCVSGIGSLEIDYQNRNARINGHTIKEGDWVTINGSKGNLYKGKSDVLSPDWRNNELLFILHRIIEKAIGTNSLRKDCIGKAWLFRDFFFHNIPLWHVNTDKKSVQLDKYKTFKHPTFDELNKIKHKLKDITTANSDLNLIIQGLRSCLIRQLSRKIGIGSHYKYYRPLLDPMRCITQKTGLSKEKIKYQLIGEEFFNIGKYLPNLIDIYKVNLFIEVQVDNDRGLSFLDFTNPKGESIVINEQNSIRFYLEINNTPIDSDKLPNLYNTFRMREYFWNWYLENLTTPSEMINFINLPKEKRITNFRLNTYAHELELLDNNELTNSGKALII
jgi:phosphohistidine swiveling domain-containing protein